MHSGVDVRTLSPVASGCQQPPVAGVAASLSPSIAALFLSLLSLCVCRSVLVQLRLLCRCLSLASRFPLPSSLLLLSLLLVSLTL